MPQRATIATMPDTPLTRRNNTPVTAENVTEWEMATSKQRSQVRDKMTLLDYVLELTGQGLTDNLAISSVLRRLESGELPETVTQLALDLGRKGKFPAKATIRRWLVGYKAKGREGLLTSNKGRTRKDYGWEAEAIRMYNIPSKPSYGDVADRLQAMGYESATYDRVLRYLKALPATLNAQSPQRIGKHEYHLTHKPSRHRDTDVLLVGECYQGDGHTIDAYLAHPNTGNAYRPELTIWIDVRSRYITGWWLSEAESQLSTLFALSHAFTSHDHVPAWLHIDNGSGYKAKLMNDESLGFYSRFNLSTMFSIPGNPRGKGQVERWFRTLRDKHDKFWNDGLDYCGHDQADETNRRLSVDVRSGKRKLLSVDDYQASIAEFIDYYNNRKHSALNNKSPAELWSTLERVAVHTPAEAIIRPRVERTVRKFSVRLDNRHYKTDELMHYDGARVIVEYDLHNDSEVACYDSKGRLICMAQLTHKIAYLPDSRLEEGRQKRLKGQKKRLEAKLEEKERQSRAPIESPVLKEIQQMQELGELLEPVDDDQSTIESPINIDLTDFEE